MRRFPMFQHRRKALVADDDQGTLELFNFLLREEGWDVVEARTGEEVIAKAQEESPCVLLLDNKMPVMSGAEAYSTLESSGVHIPAILISGVGDVKEVAARAGISRCFLKPVEMSELLDAMDEACREGK